MRIAVLGGGAMEDLFGAGRPPQRADRRGARRSIEADGIGVLRTPIVTG
jgi:hypothetical protein